MGFVVAARHLGLNQDVALKLVRNVKADETQVARFLREARTAAKIKSDHVARILDVGRLEDGRPYLVMELLEGRDLSSIAVRGSLLPISQVVQYVLQACQALAEAHAQGIVHRDLKPGNLFLAKRSDGTELVKVLDFGVSKVVSPDEKAMTKTRDWMGTPAYMSPEQLRSAKKIDARADLWSLGVILFELLSGSLPFEAANIADLCAQILVDQAPSLRPRAAGVPPGLEAVVQRCLEKNPDKRYSTVLELARDLAPFAQADVAAQIARIERVAKGSILTPVDQTLPMGVRAASVAPTVLRAPQGPGALEGPGAPTALVTRRRPPPIPRWVISLLGVVVGLGAVALVAFAIVTVASARARRRPMPSVSTPAPSTFHPDVRR
jgi:serine/threonine-protein kinase